MSRSRRQVPMWAKLGHAKPVTRRDLLASGIIPFAAWAVGPSLATLLNPLRAEAQGASGNCGAAPASTAIPFITLNLQGGASFASQVVPKTINGDPIKSFTKLGLGTGPGISFNIEKEFQGVDFAGTAIGGNVQGLVSKFLTGLRLPRANQMTRIAALDNTAFLWQAAASGDDTSSNHLDVTGLVLKMGLQGSKLPNLGRSDSSTGIGQMPAVLPPPSPFVVGSVTDLTNALGYAAGLTGLKPKQKEALARTIANLSSGQIKRLGEVTGPSGAAQIVECAGLKNVDLIATGGGDINPFSGPSAAGGPTQAEMLRIWAVNAADLRSQDAVFGAMVYNGLVGNASTINLNMGGYDYHDGTRATGDGRDLNAGRVVGKILETAAFLKKPVFIYVCSDGSTVSGESATADSAWMSDRGIASMNFMFAFHPDKRPSTSGNQIGGFNDGQAVDGKFPTGNNAELAAQAVFANYAAWNGRMDFLEQYRVLGDAALRSSAIKLAKG